jgi:hypothetical protein
MPITDIDPEDEINQQRKAEHKAERDDGGIVDTVEDVADSLVRPLFNRRPDEEDLEERREENDREQRPG